MLKEALKRSKKPTPKFFKKLINIGITIGSVGATILGIKSQMPELPIPEIVETISGYMIATGTVIAGVAKCTVDDTKIQDFKPTK